MELVVGKWLANFVRIAKTIFPRNPGFSARVETTMIREKRDPAVADGNFWKMETQNLPRLIDR